MALFAEMYGFPLTIFLFSGWLGAKFPGVNLFGHDAGHLWWLFTGQHGNPHAGVLHILSLVAILIGFLLQWPTLLSLAMFPVLVVMYVRLAISEEHDSEREFGEAWRAYAAVTPRFLPSWGDISHRHAYPCDSHQERRVAVRGWRHRPWGGIGVARAHADAAIRAALLSVGVILHGAGMTLKHRLEADDHELQWWDRSLFWACWSAPLATLGWVACLLVARPHK